MLKKNKNLLTGKYATIILSAALALMTTGCDITCDCHGETQHTPVANKPYFTDTFVVQGFNIEKDILHYDREYKVMDLVNKNGKHVKYIQYFENEEVFIAPEYVHHQYWCRRNYEDDRTMIGGIQRGDKVLVSLHKQTYPAIPGDTVKIIKNLTAEQVVKDKFSARR